MSDNDLIRRGDVAKILCDAYDDGMIDEGELAFLISEANKIPAVPHEMSAREFLHNFHRLCQSMGCDECPITHDDEPRTCAVLMGCFPDETIETVGKWAAEHPEKKWKTYAEDFFEKFPNAEPKYYDGRGKKQMIPIPCRQHCYGVVGQKCNGIGCSCSACWNAEMEGEE